MTQTEVENAYHEAGGNLLLQRRRIGTEDWIDCSLQIIHWNTAAFEYRIKP